MTYNPAEPRDRRGRWSEVEGRVKQVAHTLAGLHVGGEHHEGRVRVRAGAMRGRRVFTTGDGTVHHDALSAAEHAVSHAGTSGDRDRIPDIKVLAEAARRGGTEAHMRALGGAIRGEANRRGDDIYRQVEQERTRLHNLTHEASARVDVTFKEKIRARMEFERLHPGKSLLLDYVESDPERAAWNVANAEYQKASEEHRARQAELIAFEIRAKSSIAQSFLDVLKEVRPGYGEGTIEYKRAPSVRGTVDAAASFLPKEWIDASNKVGPLSVRVSDGSRAHYDMLDNRVMLRRRTKDTGTALHELGHRMEHTASEALKAERVKESLRISEEINRLHGSKDKLYQELADTSTPNERVNEIYAEIRQVEKRVGELSIQRERIGGGYGKIGGIISQIEEEFWRRRTNHGEDKRKLREILPNHGYRSREVADPDEFADPYVGKDYGTGFWEILTMGLEGVFFGRYDLVRKDPEHADLTLGMLASLDIDKPAKEPA